MKYEYNLRFLLKTFINVGAKEKANKILYIDI